MNSKTSYARLYQNNGDNTKITYELTEQLTKIGRNEKVCDICVDLPSIDMIHFLIEYDKTAGLVQITNNSKRIMYINETKLTHKQKCPQRDLDTIYLRDIPGNTIVFFLYNVNPDLQKKQNQAAVTNSQAPQPQDDSKDTKMAEIQEKEKLKKELHNFQFNSNSNPKSSGKKETSNEVVMNESKEATKLVESV